MELKNKLKNILMEYSDKNKLINNMIDSFGCNHNDENIVINLDKIINFDNIINSLNYKAIGEIIDIYNDYNIKRIPSFKYDYYNGKLYLKILYFKKIEILDWLKNSKYGCKIIDKSFHYVCVIGDIQFLEWINLNIHIDTKLSNLKNIDIKTLEWLNNNNYILECNIETTNYFIDNNHISKLIWLKQHNYNIEYNNNSIKKAFENENIEIINWFKLNYNISFQYNSSHIKSNKILEYLKLYGNENSIYIKNY
jgi:hypothetical protein